VAKRQDPQGVVREKSLGERAWKYAAWLLLILVAIPIGLVIYGLASGDLGRILPFQAAPSSFEIDDAELERVCGVMGMTAVEAQEYLADIEIDVVVSNTQGQPINLVQQYGADSMYATYSTDDDELQWNYCN
jgi:hypothetical protein